MAKVITKKEIRTKISEIKTLEKAHRICICDYDLAKDLIYSMAKKMAHLLRLCINRAKAKNDTVAIDFLIGALDEIVDSIDEEDDCIYSWIHNGTMLAIIGQGETVIDVCVLQH